MKEIRKKSDKKSTINVPEGAASNKYIPLDDEREYIAGLAPQGVNDGGKEQSAFTKRIKKSARILFAVGFLSMIIYGMGSTSKSVDTGEEAASALETHISTSLAAGTKLLASDDNYVGGDITIVHESTDDETILHVWDYAAEDGDYVQILINGIPLVEPFMITNKPVAFKVPTVGAVEVLGTRDGGGGITYAVYYEMNHTTYFNGVGEDGGNLYTLTRE